MKLVQELSFNQDISQELSIEQLNKNAILIKIKNYNFITQENNEGHHIVNKDELSELIGGLLHIQSKLNRK